MTTLDRIAKVIMPEAYDGCGQYDGVTAEEMQCLALMKARAALDVLRQPTDLMLSDGWAVSPREWQGRYQDLTGVFSAMIDSVLDEIAVPEGWGE